MANASRSLCWVDGEWLQGNPPILGPLTHGLWLGSCVFDGARAFEGVMPDLDLHCQRVNASAEALGLRPTKRWQEIVELVREGVARFSGDTALYIKPLYWAEEGGYVSVPPLPESTRFALAIYEAPMLEPTGFSITATSFRRPTIEQAPVNAKAACLYPNSGRAVMEAHAKGFENGVVFDAMGNVAELATANLMLVKDGAVHTPYPNGTFLNGITRQRVIKLLRGAGIEVHERIVTYRDLLEADELFSTGNYSKVTPINRIDDRHLQPGPVAAKARELYWAFAHGQL
ncbi:branched-chain amino acid aminotransferase [Lutibaculum baratangense]|uniref:Probable branched-chain-amino-acid aminotransferase n=1 Tax=Lutibaculum baratangense AMV1 TaxID=631454 RepID=V4QYM0_9HYPH|nr:branched-chain amino acid aminotransferase [Lutibaculum baratangense]ESR24847.1 Branched-chain amino acid aminotransferase [Lutibaculum baratangense AMV1]